MAELKELKVVTIFVGKDFAIDKVGVLGVASQGEYLKPIKKLYEAKSLSLEEQNAILLLVKSLKNKTEQENSLSAKPDPTILKEVEPIEEKPKPGFLTYLFKK